MRSGPDLSGAWVLMLAIWIAILIIPFAVGLNLLRQVKRHEWYAMAALLTLLPVVTGPIWFLLGITTPFLGEAFMKVLPGIVLTCIIAIRFRRCFAGPTASMAWILLILGCVRLLNSLIIDVTSMSTIVYLFMIIGAVLPTIYAIVAVYLSKRVQRMMP